MDTLSETNSTSLPLPKRSTRVGLLLIILILGVGIDQGTKYWAETNLVPGRVISMLGDTFRIQFAMNPGAFLGLGGSLSPEMRFWLLTAVNGVFLVAIGGLMLAKWTMPTSQFVALGLLLSGGIGNLIDRVTQNGEVTDFLNLGIGWLRTGIFNVADMAIMAGAGMLFWLSFKPPETPEPAKASTDG